MARIKIKDLPIGQKISREELKKIYGGLLVSLADPRPTPIYSYQPMKSGMGQAGILTYTSGVITDT